MITLRSALRRIPLAKWLAGCYRRWQFQKRLRDEQSLYDPRSGIPPPMLRFRVHGALDENSYIGVGQAVAQIIVTELGRINVSLENLHVLDFACGPGRVMTALARMATSCQFHGSDIDAEAIAWAQEHLAHIGRFQKNSAKPPSRYQDGTFDLVYTISLFTHLDERSQFDWLEDLRRVLKPGGHLLATLHGRNAQASCSSRERADLRHHGFHYRVDHKGALKLDGLPDSYQTAFHSKDYVTREWGRIFELVSYNEGGLHGHQDVVILRKRGT